MDTGNAGDQRRWRQPVMALDLAEIKRVFRLAPGSGAIHWKVTTGPRGKLGDIAGTTKPNASRYHKIQYMGRKYPTHKIVYALYNNVWPPVNIDHIDGNTYNNRPENLRLATQAENNKNARNRKDNKSGVRGVCWNKAKNRWVVSIGIKGKNNQVGVAVSFSDAVALRIDAEKMYKYHPNHGRV
jgi:hypothetical protein